MKIKIKTIQIQILMLKNNQEIIQEFLLKEKLIKNMIKITFKKLIYKIINHHIKKLLIEKKYFVTKKITIQLNCTKK